MLHALRTPLCSNCSVKEADDKTGFGIKEGTLQMNAATLIAGAIVVLILFLAVRYIYKEKKKGSACIGCPYAGTCRRHHSGQSCSGFHESE